MIAVREAWRAGLFGRAHWASNLAAGLVVGVVALPLAMAFPIASGARPEQGIYTGIVAGVLAALFGSSRVSISGPTGAFIVILAGITAQYGIAGLQIATLMAGLILLTMGLVKLGSIIRFIPTPVITGFTAGIAVIIWVSQWKDFFGLQPAAAGAHFHEKLRALIEALPGLHLPTTLLSLAALAILIVSPRVLRRIPGPLVALVALTVAQAWWQFDGVATIGSAFGGIPAGLPMPQWPDMSFARVLELIGPAFTIAMLGAIRSAIARNGRRCLATKMVNPTAAPMKPPKITRPPSGMLAISSSVSPVEKSRPRRLMCRPAADASRTSTEVSLGRLVFS